MKKLLWLFLLALPLAAQPNNPSVRYVSGAPSGTCSPAPPIQVVDSTGTIYTCDNGTWAAQGGGGGGNLSGTLTAGFVPIATGVNTLGDSTIDDGVTASGTLTIQTTDENGIVIAANTGGLKLSNSNDEDPRVADGAINLFAGAGLQLVNDPTANKSNGLSISNLGIAGTSITDSGGGGIALNQSAAGEVRTSITDSGAGIELIANGGSGGGISLNSNGANGTSITDSGGNGITIQNTNAASNVNISSNGGNALGNNGPLGTNITDSGGGGISLSATNGGTITINGGSTVMDRCSGGTSDGFYVAAGSTAATACTSGAGTLVNTGITTP
jgi:hypothetical protein